MQYWRLFSNQLAFHQCVLRSVFIPRSTAWLMGLALCMRSGLAVSLGLYVIFQFRVLERQVRLRSNASAAYDPN